MSKRDSDTFIPMEEESSSETEVNEELREKFGLFGSHAGEEEDSDDQEPKQTYPRNKYGQIILPGGGVCSSGSVELYNTQYKTPVIYRNTNQNVSQTEEKEFSDIDKFGRRSSSEYETGRVRDPTGKSIELDHGCVVPPEPNYQFAQRVDKILEQRRAEQERIRTEKMIQPRPRVERRMDRKPNQNILILDEPEYIIPEKKFDYYIRGDYAEEKELVAGTVRTVCYRPWFPNLIHLTYNEFVKYYGEEPYTGILPPGNSRTESSQPCSMPMIHPQLTPTRPCSECMFVGSVDNPINLTIQQQPQKRIEVIEISSDEQVVPKYCIEQKKKKKDGNTDILSIIRPDGVEIKLVEEDIEKLMERIPRDLDGFNENERTALQKMMEVYGMLDMLEEMGLQFTYKKTGRKFDSSYGGRGTRIELGSDLELIIPDGFTINSEGKDEMNYKDRAELASLGRDIVNEAKIRSSGSKNIYLNTATGIKKKIIEHKKKLIGLSSENFKDLKEIKARSNENDNYFYIRGRDKYRRILRLLELGYESETEEE